MIHSPRMNEAPSSFGKYFLTEKIATGGMAEIYLAKLVGPGGFEKFLIIKKIHPELSGERQFVEMFVAEAKTLVSLTHGNIVPIYELGMVDSTYFIAMEYIDGPTVEQLQKALKRGGQPLSSAMSAYICAEVLKGLDYAHRKGEGVIHRDLSPRNVMLSREGEVKLVDFGIAVGRGAGASASVSTVDAPTGSYPHMSPEQARGETLDPRSDLFAVGILLWELLTGQALFARKTDEETLKAVLEYPIPAPSTACPGTNTTLDEICARALERERGDRYATAGEFLLALNHFLYSQSETVSPGDISSMVARNCPPTAAESARPRTEAGPQRSGTVPLARAGLKRSGTVPMARPHGKQRAETVRTFATHVQFQSVLSSATPIHGVPVVDIPATPTPAPEERDSPADLAKPAPIAMGVTQEIPKQSSGERKMPLLIAGLVALGGIGAAVAVLSSSSPAPAPVLAAPMDASTPPVDAARDAAAPPIVADASVPDAGIADAGKRVPPRKRIDARAAVKLGSVRVAANPWADVYLNGKSLGRAPGSFRIPAGKHVLELRNGSNIRRVPVTVQAGELKSLPLVDFRND